MGLTRALAAFACALVAIVAAAPAHADALGDAAAYLQSRQHADGGFAEPGAQPTPGLTAWAVLGLAAAGRPPASAAEYLAGRSYPSTTDLALRILALAALGRPVQALADQLEQLRRGSGRIGPAVNSTVWGAIALTAAGRAVDRATVDFLLAAQEPSGGWAWAEGVAPDADDTAAAIQALRAAGVSSRAPAIGRGLAFLRTRQRPDGGFELERGRGSNAQSTAWALQAFLATGRSAGAKARAYLLRLQRDDGSFRFSARATTTPVWVTAQALAALAGRAFPLSVHRAASRPLRL